MTRLARPLELVAGGVTAVLIAVFATGGWTVGGVPFTRAEDLVVVLAALIALRALVAPLAVPTVPPLRAGRWAAGALRAFAAPSRAGRSAAAPSALSDAVRLALSSSGVPGASWSCGVNTSPRSALATSSTAWAVATSRRPSAR